MESYEEKVTVTRKLTNNCEIKSQLLKSHNCQKQIWNCGKNPITIMRNKVAIMKQSKL